MPRDCAGCHEDVHAGQFRLTEPVRTCETCHTTDGFDIQSFDHAKNTVWPLDGKHGRIACDACHGQEKLRNGQDAVRWRLGYHQCRDCHANPHREAKHP